MLKVKNLVKPLSDDKILFSSPSKTFAELEKNQCLYCSKESQQSIFFLILLFLLSDYEMSDSFFFNSLAVHLSLQEKQICGKSR